MDDIPSNQVIKIYWHFIDSLPNIPVNSTTDGVNIIVTDPKSADIKKVLTTKGQLDQKGQSKGKFSFATQEGGQYRFCLKTTTSHWIKENNKIRYGLRIIIGEQDEVTDAAKETHLNSLQEKIHSVMNKAKEFSAFQEMSRQDEDKLSTENLKINERVVLATIVQTIVIVLSGIYQIISLRRFFKSKNIV